MKRILGLVFAALLLTIAAYAHGNNDHILGVVSQISDAGITVQLANKTSKTVTLVAQTTFEKSGHPAALRDLKVGDRVVIDVEKGKLEAHEVKFGPPAAKKATAATTHQHEQ
jgi:ribosomal protein S1